MNFDDRQLKDFLQKHQPIAPAGESDQLKQLLSKIGLKKRKRWVFAPWFTMGGALTACMLAFILITNQSPQKDLVGANLVAVEEAWLEDDDLYENRLPTLDIGEDYLRLVAASSD